MKTLWIVTELFPPDETSTAYIMGEIANAMSQKYVVKVITGPEIYDKRKKIDTNNLFRLNPYIQVYRVKTVDVDKNTIIGKAEGLLASSYKLAREVNIRVKAEDKVLLVTNPLPLIVFVAKLKKKIGFELNLLVHDIFPENTKAANVKIPLRPIVSKLFAWAYSKADLYVVLGRDMVKVLKKKIQQFNKTPNIKIIENWADTVSIWPIDRSGNDIISIEYAGNIGRGQGLCEFIDCLYESRNQNIQLHLYGTGALEESLRRDVKKRKIANVIFHGSYFRSQQNEVLNNCDIALVSLSDEAYGIGVPSKTYNILASGKPILYLGHPESEIALMVKEHDLGYVFSHHDKKGIIGFLSKLDRKDIKNMKQMGVRGRIIAEERYSKEKILSMLFETI